MLQPQHLKRLRQIELQVQIARSEVTLIQVTTRGPDGTKSKLSLPTTRRLPISGAETSVFSVPAVVRDLKLTDQQQEKLKAIEADRRKAMAPVFLTGEEHDAIARKVTAHHTGTYDQLTQVLSTDQRAQLQDMIGAAHRGEVRPPTNRGGRGGGGPPITTAPAYLWNSALTFAPAKALHDELKLTADQAKRLTELPSTAVGRGGRGADQTPVVSAQERAQALEKQFAAILTPEQMKRFKQLVLQHMDDNPPSQAGGTRRYAPGMIARVEEAAKQLKLDAAQKERILNQEPLRVVLNPEQQATWQEMKGQPFAVNLFPTNPGGRFGASPPPPTFQYLQQKSVQDDVKITDSQRAKLPELEKNWQVPFQNFTGTPPERARLMTELRSAMDKAIDELLDPKQSTRVRQIELQQFEKAGVGLLLEQPRVVKELAPTEDQTKRLAALNEDADKTSYLISLELVPSAGQRGRGPQDDYTKTDQAFRQIVDKKLVAVLTDGQRAKLKELLGEPFRGELPPGIVPAGRGIGGFGIGGFGGGGLGGGAFPFELFPNIGGAGGGGISPPG